MPNGDPVAKLALAYNYGRKVDGKQPTQWLDASIFGKRAESLAQYLTKGTGIVATVDDVHVRTYNKSDGTPGVSLSGTVSAVEFAGQRQEAAPAARPARTKPAEPAEFVDDDLSF
jgi:single-strand DNA-binding protein